MRGVGDEAALAVEHRLGLGVRGVERVQHALQRARELGDLVVGLGRRDGARRVVGARDLRGGARQLARSAASRGARSSSPASSARPLPREHAEQQQQLDARDRRLDVAERAAVLDEDVAAGRRR